MTSRCLVFVLTGIVSACVNAPRAPLKESVMKARASGQFDVKVSPLPADDKSGEPLFGRYSIDKRFQGDLEGISKGEMLASGTGQSSSGAYVALERVTGTLQRRTGSFLLQHNGH